ncbi:MAG: hypothetical protein QNJ47_26440 [Nostocaceae cyanobacterium]|nr:hypothetical protein [Nostocaceae cyanobacterium]
MIQVIETQWSKTEEKIARQAFDKAYEREISTLIKEVQQQASQITELEHLWLLHDFLSARRHEIDGKYDYRYSSLVFVFALLLKEGWLDVDELEGLNPDKLAKIVALSRM